MDGIATKTDRLSLSIDRSIGNNVNNSAPNDQ
jgi:hypothetical protein